MGIFGMAGTPLALERSYGCLNCDFWDEGMGRMAGEGAISVEGIFLRRLKGWFGGGQ